MTSLEQLLPPTGLSDRGERLWTAVMKDYSLDPGAELVLEEACRMADRLERLHKALRSNEDKAWFSLAEDSLDLVDTRHGEVAKIKIVVDPGLAEARQLQLAFRQMIDRLGIGHGELAPEVESDPFEEFNRRRAEREAKRAAEAG
jgi:hypothetical protein